MKVKIGKVAPKSKSVVVNKFEIEKSKEKTKTKEDVIEEIRFL